MRNGTSQLCDAFLLSLFKAYNGMLRKVKGLPCIVRLSIALIPKELVLFCLNQANHRLIVIDLAWGDAKR